MTDRLAIIEQLSDGTSIIRGRSLGDVLFQFDWAVRTSEGVRIPTPKTPVAEAALRAAGCQVNGGSGSKMTDSTTTIREAVTLPECSECHAPYRRGTIPQPRQVCHKCGAPLVLVEVYTRRDERGHGYQDYRPYNVMPV